MSCTPTSDATQDAKMPDAKMPDAVCKMPRCKVQMPLIRYVESGIRHQVSSILNSFSIFLIY